MRVHLLGIPQTVSAPHYSVCAFTTKVVKMVRMLRAEGHDVIHYGHEDSETDCPNIPVTTRADVYQTYGNFDPMTAGMPPALDIKSHIYKTYIANCIREIAARKEPDDFLMITYGRWQEPIAAAFPDLLTVEPCIGYPDNWFAEFKAFESYALMHAAQGNGFAMEASNEHWYEAVIPYPIDPNEFTYGSRKDDYLLFIGRGSKVKGLDIACSVAQQTKTKLIIAGSDRDTRLLAPGIEHVGVVGPEQRRDLLTHARAVILPSRFLEPFNAVQAEAMMSGTPVISSDFGAFTEYNLHGVTGYRCRTMDHFVKAVDMVSTLDPVRIRSYARRRFSLERVAPMHTEFLRSVADYRVGGGGWVSTWPERANLDSTSVPYVRV